MSGIKKMFDSVRYTIEIKKIDLTLRAGKKIFSSGVFRWSFKE